MTIDANPTQDAGADLSVEERIESFIEQDEATQEDEVTHDNQSDEDVVEDAIEDSDSEVSDEEDVSTEEAETTYETEVDYYADKFGVNKDYFLPGEDGKVLIKTKIDGKESTLEFDKLLRGYQTDQHNNNKSQALSESQKQFDTQKQAVEQQLLGQLQQANELASFAETQLTAEFNAINWQALRDADPAEYTARRQDYAEKAQQLQQIKQAAGEQLTAQQQEAQQGRAKKFGEYVEQQMQSLTEKVPEWSDQNVKAQEIGEINSFLSSQYGFEPDVLSSVYDHRLYILGRDAMKANKVKQATNKKIKKPVPKFQKPGAVTRKSDKANTKSRNKLGQFKKTGSLNDLTAVLLDRI